LFRGCGRKGGGDPPHSKKDAGAEPVLHRRRI
jgi:hypothetical protein